MSLEERMWDYSLEQSRVCITPSTASGPMAPHGPLVSPTFAQLKASISGFYYPKDTHWEL